MYDELPSPIHIVVKAGDQQLIDELLLIIGQNDLPIVLHQFDEGSMDSPLRVTSFAERLKHHQVLIIGSGHSGIGASISAHYAYQEAVEQTARLKRPIYDFSFDPAVLEEFACSVKKAKVELQEMAAQIQPYLTPEKPSRRSGKKGKGFSGARNRVICNDAYTQPRHR